MSKKEAAVTRAELDINEAGTILGDVMKRHATVDASGAITIAKEAQAQLLEAGNNTPAEQKKQQDYNSHLNTAAHLTLVELGVPHLAKHPELKEVSIVVQNGRDQISAVLHRETTSRNPATGETSTIQGAVRGKYRTYGTTNSRGDLKKVLDYGKRLADSLL